MSDVIGAEVSDEMYEEIEEFQEQSDTISTRSAAIRELLRRGLDVTDKDNRTWKNRLTSTVAVLLISGYPALAAYYDRPDSALLFVALFVFLALAGDYINQQIDRLADTLTSLYQSLFQ